MTESWQSYRPVLGVRIGRCDLPGATMWIISFWRTFAVIASMEARYLCLIWCDG
jgi:hypothetical protein